MSKRSDTQTAVDAKDLAVKAALAAGEYLRDRFHQPRKISYKGRVNLVTDADRGAEQLIASMIAERFPWHRMLGEEGTQVGSDVEHLWVVDPLDGTSNYAHGYPNYAVSIAYLNHGQVALGVVYVPPRDELFVAERGKGAFLAGKRLKVSSTPDLLHSLVCTGFPYDRPGKLPQLTRVINGFAEVAQTVRADGSAAADLCYIAAGRFDTFWENDLSPWDTAAGSLMITEAGGRISAGQGEPYDMYSREILASNGLVHEASLEVVARASDP
jgi:myo-inositol-1(or 4)-monophosphatase